MSDLSVILDKISLEPNSDVKKHRLIVRIITNFYADKNGLYLKKLIKFLKRKSFGLNILDEDVKWGDVDSVISRIINLYEVEDGIYEVITVNETRDWETGYVEEYDYELIKIEEEKDYK